jgi:hypothetical protein
MRHRLVRGRSEVELRGRKQCAGGGRWNVGWVGEAVRVLKAEGAAPPMHIHGSAEGRASPRGRRTPCDASGTGVTMKVTTAAALTVMRGRGVRRAFPHAPGAPDRILPRRGRLGVPAKILGFRGAPTRFWGRRCGPVFGPKPKMSAGRVLRAV